MIPQKEWKIYKQKQIIKPLKIAITGTHSTGKTTLAKKLSEELGMKYIRGDKAIKIVTELFKNKKINELNTKEQFKLQKEMFKSFNEALNNEENIITDGLHLTCIPYSLTYTNNEITKEPGYMTFINEVLEQTKKFNIFYIPPEIKLENNGFRPTDEKLRITIDNQLYELLKNYEFRTITGNTNNRIKTIKNHLWKDNEWKNYIVIEGLPRSGKTTIIKQIIEKARKENKKIYLTKRNNNKYMKEVKKILRENPYGRRKELITLSVESLKKDYQENNIEERIKEGQIVISDRQKYTIMTIANYSGIPRNEIYQALYDIPEPGTTIYIKTNPSISVLRSMITSPEKTLKKDFELQQKVYDYYEELSKQHDFKIINNNQPLKEIGKEINKIIF